MFSKTVGTITFHFGPLLIWVGLILFVFFIYLIHTIVLELKLRGIAKDLATGYYNDVIEHGKKLLNIYQKYNMRLSTKQIRSKIEYLNFSLAVSFFAISNDDQFLLYINQMNSSVDVKEFWLSLFYLNRNDFETATMHYSKIELNDSTYVYRTFLTSFEAHKKGNEDHLARSKMIEVIDQLKHPVLKQIADLIIKN